MVRTGAGHTGGVMGAPWPQPRDDSYVGGPQSLLETLGFWRWVGELQDEVGPGVSTDSSGQCFLPSLRAVPTGRRGREGSLTWWCSGPTVPTAQRRKLRPRERVSVPC